MIVFIVFMLVAGIGAALYTLHRAIDAHFAQQKALWNAQVEFTLAIIRGERKHP